MKRKTALLLCLILAVTLVFSGCGSSGSGDGEDGDQTLTVRKKNAMMSTDWEKTTESEDMQITWVQVFEGLYGINEAEGGYVKQLAKDVQISDDQLQYTVTLQDATFQNGDPLKASDVVFSYDRAMSNPRFNYVTSMIDKVEAVDDSTVLFHLKYPYSPIAHTFFSIKIASEKEVTEAGDSFGTSPHTAGTGPYMITDFNMASNIKLKAYDGYWRGEPKVKNVEYVVISEDSAAVIAYENGEIDYIHDAPTAEWDVLEKAAGDNCGMAKGNNVRCVSINWESKANNNVLGKEQVRKAICYAIDKESINQAVVGGMGVVAQEYMPSEYVETSPKASDGGFELYEYDPEKAKELLHEAGFTDADLEKGVDVGTILSYGAQTGQNAKIAQVIQANLSEVGLTAGVEILDIAIASPRMHSFDYDLAVFADSGNYDFNNIRQQVHSESEGMSVIRYKTDNSPFDGVRIEELIDKAVATSDVAERVGYYTELWKIVQDSATILPLFHAPVGICWSPNLNPGELNPTFYHLYDMSWK